MAVTVVKDVSRVVEVLQTDTQATTVNRSTQIVGIEGPGRVANAIVSDTQPSNPYEGMIWIDIS